MKKYIGIFLTVSLLFVISSLSVQAFQHWLFRPLDGISIVIDAGHGGKDQGASVNGVYEAPLNLAIAKEVEKILTEHGAIVRMTRSEDQDLAMPNSIKRKKEDMKKRVQIINDEKNDLFISLHLNTYPSETVSGAQVFHGENELSMQLAQYLQDQLIQLLGNNKSIKQAEYYLLNEARIPGVLIECGFLSNPQELSLLQKADYQKKIASAIFAGIRDFLEANAYE